MSWSDDNNVDAIVEMKNVWRMVNAANFKNRDRCCMVSISICPSNLTNASRIFGRREINTTSRSGANRAMMLENQA